MLSIGVVIPAYNGARVLGDALESVLDQDPPPAEVVVVDDGSTDETPTVLVKYAGRVQCARQPNRGVSAARNAGLARLTSSAVVFLDQDDLLLPGALACRSALLEETGAVWAHTDGYFEESGMRNLFSKRYRPIGGRFDGFVFADLLCRNFITTHAVIARRTVVQELGGFDEEIRETGEWDLWLRLAVRYPVRHSATPTFVYRWTGTNVSRNRPQMDLMRWQTLVKAHRLFPSEVREAGEPARRSVADARNALAYRLATGGGWDCARGHLWASVRLWPWQRRAWLMLARCLVGRGRSGAPADSA